MPLFFLVSQSTPPSIAARIANTGTPARRATIKRTPLASVKIFGSSGTVASADGGSMWRLFLRFLPSASCSSGLAVSFAATSRARASESLASASFGSSVTTVRLLGSR